MCYKIYVLKEGKEINPISVWEREGVKKGMEWIKVMVDYGIIGILISLSIISLGLTIERYLVYKRINIDEFIDKNSLEIALTQRLHHLATIGSNAPYIGLLGTVLGIMMTFYTIGRVGFVDSTKIMVGLALALKATAIGLLVAIPSIVFYNMLLRKVNVLLLQWESENGKKGI